MRLYSTDRRELLVLLVAIGLGTLAARQMGYSLHLNSGRAVLIYLVMAPVLEEYVFRYHLQQWIAQRWRAPGLALLASSLIFVICHMPWIGLWALGLLMPALVLGWYWMRFKSLWFNVGLHSALNAALGLATLAG